MFMPEAACTSSGEPTPGRTPARAAIPVVPEDPAAASSAATIARRASCEVKVMPSSHGGLRSVALVPMGGPFLSDVGVAPLGGHAGTGGGDAAEPDGGGARRQHPPRGGDVRGHQRPIEGGLAFVEVDEQLLPGGEQQSGESDD